MARRWSMRWPQSRSRSSAGSYERRGATRRRRAALGPNRSAPPRTTARRPPPRSSAPPSREREDLVRAVADAGARGRRRRRRRARCTASRRSAGGQRGERAPTCRRGRSAPRRRRASSTAASSRRSSSVRSTFASAAGWSARSAGSSSWRTRLRANAGASFVGSSRQASPRAAQCAAVSSRVTAEQRPHQPALARAHAEQRPAPGRGGEPVEHRLDLVGGGVAGGDDAAAPARAPRPRRSARRAPTPAGCPRAGAARAADVQRDAEPLAQRRAVRLVAGRRVAQPVVECSAVDRPAPASRTATSSRHTESRPPESSTSTGRPGRSRPAGADALAVERRAASRRRRREDRKRRDRGRGPAAWRAMRPAASAGGVRLGDALRGTTGPPTSRPIAWFGWRKGLPLGRRVSIGASRSDHEVRVFRLDELAVAGEHRLRDRHQAQRGLDVAARLDAPAGDRDARRSPCPGSTCSPSRTTSPCCTFGSQSTSSVHSQCRLPSSPGARGADVHHQVDVRRTRSAGARRRRAAAGPCPGPRPSSRRPGPSPPGTPRASGTRRPWRQVAPTTARRRVLGRASSRRVAARARARSRPAASRPRGRRGVRRRRGASARLAVGVGRALGRGDAAPRRDARRRACRRARRAAGWRAAAVRARGVGRARRARRSRRRRRLDVRRSSAVLGRQRLDAARSARRPRRTQSSARGRSRRAPLSARARAVALGSVFSTARADGLDGLDGAARVGARRPSALLLLVLLRHGARS